MTVMARTRRYPCCGRPAKFDGLDPARRHCRNCKTTYDVTFVAAAEASRLTRTAVMKAVWERVER